VSTASSESSNRLVFLAPDPDVKTILFVVLITPIGRMRLAATARGLVRVELPSAEAEARMNVWLALHFPEAARRAGVNPILRKAAAQLEAYFTGQLRAFSLPVQASGTAFQTAVWQRVTTIPFGSTRTYQDIARELGNRASVRAVGAAQRANPLPILIPCHRLVASGGELTGYAGGLPAKRWLLDHEQAERDEAEPQPATGRRPGTVLDRPPSAPVFRLRPPTPRP
jgi:methylated-DNA-[protein]-cysteine S-methyltransferase